MNSAAWRGFAELFRDEFADCDFQAALLARCGGQAEIAWVVFHHMGAQPGLAGAGGAGPRWGYPRRADRRRAGRPGTPVPMVVSMIMTPNEELFAFQAGFWLAVFLAVKIGNRVNGRRFGDGPSLIPVIPFYPLAAGLLGWLVNRVAAPWGTQSVVALHALLLIALLWRSRAALRAVRLRRDGRDPGPRMTERMQLALEAAREDVIAAAEHKLGRGLTNRERSGILGMASLLMLEAFHRGFDASATTPDQVLGQLEQLAADARDQRSAL